MDKYCNALDSNGHFTVAKMNEREKVIKLLKEIHDGDYWANEAEGYMDGIEINNESDLLAIDNDKWNEFVESFIQRGTMEIIEI